MRGLAYCVFVYIMLGLQIGVARHIAYHGGSPNFGLIAVVFLAINAKRQAALLGAIGIGFLQDLLTLQTPGVFAFAYGLAALAIVNAGPMLRSQGIVTHLLATLGGGAIVLIVVLLHGLIRPAVGAATTGKTALPAMRISPVVELIRLLYTVIVSPVILALLTRARGVFGFAPDRTRRR